ncbi:MAG TPA: TRAP transporter small permease subunit [Casimicrobiaceae bacterium]|jgi:TRAP-type mannitol/chloroaromatic compound transport system permease small subunit
MPIVRPSMPNLNFILPHWLYWGALLVFPLVAMYLVRRQMRDGPPREPIYFNAYLFLITAGFMGLHRMYLKSWWGLLYLPFFAGVLYCGTQERDVREDVSRTYAALERAQTAADVAKPNDPATATEEERKTYADATADLNAKKADFEAADAVRATWHDRSRLFGAIIAALMLIDAFLIPRVVRARRARAAEAGYAVNPVLPEPPQPSAGVAEDPTLHLRTRFTDWIERINTQSGVFVAYWGVIAVFVYYYEVLARYVFNSPTNWVHESMFLMFGMQYMISGAYAYREDQHVRVDVVYSHFSPRGKAIADIVTSVFFFTFTLTMLWTGYRFAADAVNNGETSFTEWGIQYWPVKLTIPIGAALIVLQGVSKLIKDIMIVRGSVPPSAPVATSTPVL